MTRFSALSATAVFAMPVVFSSCATVLNGPAQNIHLSADKNIRTVSLEKALFADSSAHDARGPGTWLARRSHDTLIIHVKLDTGEKLILLKPGHSAAYWYNIGANYGIGMLVDRDNPKQWGYRKWNYLSLTDTGVRLRRFAPVPQGTVRLSLGWSALNLFNIKSPEGQSVTGGPIGLGAGVDYFYKEDRYLSFSAGAASSRFVDHIGKGYYPAGHTYFADFRNNYVIGSFDLGYGLSFSALRWSKITFGDTVNLDRSVRSAGMGLSLSAQYRLGSHLRVGILYQPTLWTPNRSPSFNYQHYLSLSIAWKWPVSRRR